MISPNVKITIDITITANVSPYSGEIETNNIVEIDEAAILTKLLPIKIIVIVLL